MACSYSYAPGKEFIFLPTIAVPYAGHRRFVSSSDTSYWSSCSSSQRVLSSKVRQRYGKLIKTSVGVERTIIRIQAAVRSESGTGGADFKKPFWEKVLFGSKKVRSVVLLNVIAIVYASDILVIKGAEATMDPAAFSTVRFAMSAIPFLPFLLRSTDDIQTRNAGIELGCWLSLAYFFEAVGLLTTEAGRASFISLFTVIAVPLVDGMLGAIIPTQTWFGVLMSAVGVAVLECSGSPPSIGDLLNMLSAIFFGIHMLRTERISRSTDEKKFLALLGYQTAVAAVLSSVWLLLGGCFEGQLDFCRFGCKWTEILDWIFAFPWIPALYTGVFSTGVCSFIEFAAMRDVSATETAVIYGLEPIWGAGFAWFLLGERWGTLGWIAATFILGGSLLVQIYGSPTEKSIEDKKKLKQELNFRIVPCRDETMKNGLTATPIVVRSRKSIVDTLK